MRLIKKVSTRQVKLCFVISDLTKPPRGSHFSPAVFKTHSEKARKRAFSLNDARLDAYVHGPHKRKYTHERLESYDNSDWYLAEVPIQDVGIWRRAGGLPLDWTNHSLKETAEHIRKALARRSSRLTKRARTAIPAMLEADTDAFQKNPYLLPIGFAGRSGTWPRKYLRYRTTVELDDGNMRAIALAVNGAKTIRVYYGIPKKKAR